MTGHFPWPSRAECLAAMRNGTGSGVRIAVLDTGLDLRHPDFSTLACAGCWEVLAGPDGVTIQQGVAGDPVGHGTGIAGIIHRMAPEAELISIRVLDVASRQHRHDAIREGARFALRMGASILNCSFGVPGTAFTLPTHLAWTDEAFHQAKLVVAASSNESADAPEWPAHLSSVIGVTAIAGDASKLRWREGNPVCVEAFGVGVNVPVPGGGFKSVTGSSFATAHVTGMAARMLSVYPDLSPSLIREALRHAGTPAGEGGSE